MVLSENSIPKTTASDSIHKSSTVAWIIGIGVLSGPPRYIWLGSTMGKYRSMGPPIINGGKLLGPANPTLCGESWSDLELLFP